MVIREDIRQACFVGLQAAPVGSGPVWQRPRLAATRLASRAPASLKFPEFEAGALLFDFQAVFDPIDARLQPELPLQPVGCFGRGDCSGQQCGPVFHLDADIGANAGHCRDSIEPSGKTLCDFGRWHTVYLDLVDKSIANVAADTCRGAGPKTASPTEGRITPRSTTGSPQSLSTANAARAQGPGSTAATTLGVHATAE